MKVRFYIPLLFLFVLIAVMAVWETSRSRIPEPIYQGQSLGLWLDFGSSSSAKAAVQSLGTNAIPWLLHEAPLNGNPLRYMANDLRQVRGFGWIHVAPPIDYQQRARRGFLALGTNGANAIADGLRSTDADVRFGCVGQWEVARDYSNIITEPMIERLKDPAANVRGRAANAIGMLHPQPERVVPMLIAMLNDPDGNVRSMAALGLSLYNTNAKAALPALLAGLKEHSDREFEFFATNAIKAIDPASLAKIPPK